ncbi:uncharacterized protein LOC132614742 [Lycium barbarum]|uniref:uncharacterized protein LOC132614742 n=2 Tax=Lycium barbarum TaxID=112863 RepID=UPI00293E7F70|nr:uncharacterized protein LOC132614742 [Lycium barbarum]
MDTKRKEEDKILKERDENDFYWLRKLYEAMKKANDEWDEKKKKQHNSKKTSSNYPSSNEGELKHKAYEKKDQRDTSSACRKSKIRVDVRIPPKDSRGILGKYVGAYDTSNNIFFQGKQGSVSSSVGSFFNSNKSEDERQKKERIKGEKLDNSREEKVEEVMNEESELSRTGNEWTESSEVRLGGKIEGEKKHLRDDRKEVLKRKECISVKGSCSSSNLLTHSFSSICAPNVQVVEEEPIEVLEQQLKEESSFKWDLKVAKANDLWKQLQVEDKVELDDLMWYDLIDDLFVDANKTELVPQFVESRVLGEDITQIESEHNFFCCYSHVSSLPQCGERGKRDKLSEQIQENLRKDESCSYANKLTLSCFSLLSPFMQNIEDELCVKDDDSSLEEDNLMGQGFKVWDNPLWDDTKHEFTVHFCPLWDSNEGSKGDEVSNEDIETHEAFGAVDIEKVELGAECSSSSVEKDKCSHVFNFTISLSCFLDPYLQVHSKPLHKKITFDPYHDHGILNGQCQDSRTNLL